MCHVLRKDVIMNIKKLASVAMCTLAFVCAASALGEGTQSATSAIEESEQTVLSSIAGDKRTADVCGRHGSRI